MIRSARLLSAVIAAALVVGGVGVRSLDEHDGVVAGAGQSASFRPPVLLSVSAVLADQGIRLHTGRLLAVRTRRVIDPAAFPAQVRLSGVRVHLSDEVPAGSALEVQQGRDHVEPLVRRRLVVRPNTAAGLFRGGRDGLIELRVGAVSGEVLTRRVLRNPQRGVLRVPGSLLLTFDDGPDPTWTPRVLALLKQHHVHAVFCLIGREARKYPDLVRRIVREGNLLCDHTEGHDEHLPTDPLPTAKAQILRGQQAILAASGVRARWFRAPGGAWSPTVERLAAAAGMAALKWTVDPRDWERPSARAIIDRVLGAVGPGSIVLMHDGGGDRRNSVIALRDLLVLLPRMGLHIAEPTTP